MIGAARRYRELMTTLLMDRELAGGTLREEEESRHVEALDRCWWAMSQEEQEEAERWLANDRSIEAPADLLVEDVAVERGKRSLPRKAA